KTGIGIGGGALGSIGHLQIGLDAAGVGRGVGKRRVAHAAGVAVPVGGIADSHQDIVERDHRRELRLGQDWRKIPGYERNLGIGFGRVGGAVGIAGGGG